MINVLGSRTGYSSWFSTSDQGGKFKTSVAHTRLITVEYPRDAERKVVIHVFLKYPNLTWLEVSFFFLHDFFWLCTKNKLGITYKLFNLLETLYLQVSRYCLQWLTMIKVVVEVFS